MFYQVKQDALTGLFLVVLMIRHQQTVMGRYSDPEQAEYHCQLLQERSQRREETYW